MLQNVSLINIEKVNSEFNNKEEIVFNYVS